ncbi:MAG: DUF1816 domain-containing protein [Prochloraceae cyanobacterium]|nr:DUF1816 domain-containing protein [Prochloraceae cyanobacterium]
MKEILIKILNFLGLAYWVEITTDKPKCTYYFGPFLDRKEAEIAREGYIEDLKNEGARGITIDLKRLKPDILTISQEFDDKTLVTTIASFSP